MKLLAKYNRINIIVTISVLLISSICFYVMIRHVLVSQLDEDLKLEEQEIVDFVKTNNTLPGQTNYEDQQIDFLKTTDIGTERKFSSVMVQTNADGHKEEELYRQYAFSIVVNKDNYIVFIRKSQEQTEDLIKIIVWITLGIVVLLLCVLFVINRFLLSRLWKPFNNTLVQLKQFNLSAKNNIQLQHTSTSEFAELNKTVQVMTDKAKQDYESLKNFTDNASHEMQTPLAIINSKLDVLIQDESLNEFQMQQLQGVYDALDRLSNLNQSLLLLTKIENSQFCKKEIIKIDELVTEKLFQFEELIQNKKLIINRNINPVELPGNKQLLEILINNLISNAFRYNKENGSIRIELTTSGLTVSNTSFLPGLDEQQVFQRFYRHADTRQDGNGLGLSIVKQICNIAGYPVNYTYSNNLHQFSVIF
jgi:signal transduction histidine kinase